MKSKQIKVAYSTRARSSSNLWSSASSYIETPKISMEGKWLEALGFHIGDQVKVEYEEGAIHILSMAKAEPLAMVCEGKPPYAESSHPISKK